MAPNVNQDARVKWLQIIIKSGFSKWWIGRQFKSNRVMIRVEIHGILTNNSESYKQLEIELEVASECLQILMNTSMINKI